MANCRIKKDCGCRYGQKLWRLKHDGLLLGDSGRGDGRVLFVVAHTNDDMGVMCGWQAGART